MTYFLPLLLAALCVAPAGAAWCQTCSVAATGLAFGSYQPLSGAATNSTATITVTCNPGVISLLVSYQIQLSAGSGGSFAARSMGSGGSRLSYQLYSDAAETQIWGDGTAGTVTVSDGYTLGLISPIVRTYSCYGNIPAAQRVGTGSYTDTITVLLSY